MTTAPGARCRVHQESGGGAGRINRLADIAGFVLGDPVEGRKYAEDRLAGRARAEAPA